MFARTTAKVIFRRTFQTVKKTLSLKEMRSQIRRAHFTEWQPDSPKVPVALFYRRIVNARDSPSHQAFRIKVP
jgi:hypothetical protein